MARTEIKAQLLSSTGTVPVKILRSGFKTELHVVFPILTNFAYLVPSIYSMNVALNPSSITSSLALKKTKNTI